MGKKLFLFSVFLLSISLSCRMETFREESVLSEQSQHPSNLILSFDFGGSASSRAITPEHIPVTDFGNYTIFLSGNSDNGDSLPEQVISLTNGLYGLFVEPGLWTLTAQLRQGATTLLLGTTSTLVGKETRTVELSLEPVKTGTGVVNVSFTLPQFVIDRLDPTTGTQRQVTVGLYDRNTGIAIQNMEQTFTVQSGAARTVSYNKTGVPAGQYDLKLTGNYTSRTPVTFDMAVPRTMMWSDILYVEGNRTTTETIPIPETILGVPSNPGTKLRIQGANWDGSSSNPSHRGSGSDGSFGATIHNEVLLIMWDSLHNAIHYDMEILLHPNYGFVTNTYTVKNTPSYQNRPSNDEEWKDYLVGSGTSTPAGFEMKFSGHQNDANFYKTKKWTWTKRFTQAAYMNGAAGLAGDNNMSFIFLAYRELVDGKSNGSWTGAYRLATTTNNSSWIGPADNNGLSKLGPNGTPSYRIGLEGNSNALAVLMHNTLNGNWYGIRLRAVNEFGYSDWIYYSP